ncbi:striatin [Echinococcus multilocularis]|uniref:Striatin n=1 Tax=Echinococcus multilocularis TaxID=6211 RepID=A0A068XYD7_ECHMU|nr:striatin [Echinococcus multilocularis]
MEEAGVYASQGIGGYDRAEVNSSIEQKDNHTQYTIQSVLHFIQSEWTRLELQRSQWEMERAELQARIAFLQGERRGQENIKQDLVRRIKMLEHALKQERVRYYQLKSSIDNNTDKSVDEVSKFGPDSSVENAKDYKNIMDPGRQLAHCTEQALQSNAKWRESRLKLKHFLQEVGYTDSVLAIRQSRVRQLLCATNGDLGDPESVNILRKSPSNRNSLTLPENEEAVLRTFDFLENATKSDEKPNPSVDAEAPWNDDKPAPGGISSLLPGFDSRTGQPKRFGRKTGVDNNLVEFLSSLSDKESGETEALSKLSEAVWPLGPQAPGLDGEPDNAPGASSLPPFSSTNQVEVDGASAAVGLGDLASLTVANESENGNDVEQCETGGFLSTESGLGQKQPSTSAMVGSRRPWTKRFGLKGHFDSVRSIAFHPSEPYLFSGGEDGLVMLWTLRRPGSPKPSANNAKNGNQMAAMLLANAPPDLDPVHIYRGHMSPVLSVSVPAVGQCASTVYSSSLDGVIRGWRLPRPDTFTGHFDLYSLSQSINEFGPLLKRPDSSGCAVWSISVHPSLPLLASVDTDTAVSFWPLQSDMLPGDDEAPFPIELISPSRTILLSELITPSDNGAEVGRPTSVTFFSSRPDPSNATQCLVGTSTGWLALIDVETGKVVNRVAPPTESPSRTPAIEPNFNEGDPFNHYSSNVNLNSVTYPAAGWGPRGIHAITMYQTFSLAITGHEDRCIRFYDITRQGGSNGGESGNFCVGTIVTHLDAVTCLTVDPHDLYVLTGSHDSSIRLWDLESRACVQEMTCHRVKNNESVHAVAMHPTMPLAASAGADALCKIYTSL